MVNGEITKAEKSPIFILGIATIGLILVFGTIAIAYNYGLFTGRNLETPEEGQKPTTIYGQATIDYRIITSNQWKAIATGTVIGGVTAGAVIFAPIGIPIAATVSGASASLAPSFAALMSNIGIVFVTGSAATGGAVTGGLFSLLLGQNHLTVSNVEVNEVQPYSFSLAPLFLGSGPVKCTAQLVTADDRVADQDSKTIQPFGGIGQSKTAIYTFALRAYSSETYKIRVACRDTKNLNSVSVNEMEYTTFAKN